MALIQNFPFQGKSDVEIGLDKKWDVHGIINRVIDRSRNENNFKSLTHMQLQSLFIYSMKE